MNSWVRPVELEGLQGSDILFIGLGSTAVCWYRCVLPALFLGADWIGVAGEPPRLHYATGLVRGETKAPNPLDYRVVVIQQPRGRAWLRLIRDLQARGVKVVFEIDDYVHAVGKMADHDFREHYSKDALAALELNMRVCDALICSTRYIAQRYRSFNRNVYVCENGLDLGRYRLTLPERNTVTIGWAGATGHRDSVMPWLDGIAKVMAQRPSTCFVSVGQEFALALRPHFPGRAIAVPWTTVDIYPAAMTLMDIAIAPAGRSNFYRGKSDLRWLEAGALGIPIVADPGVYPYIEHGVTGFHASTPAEARELVEALVDDGDLRARVGANARRYVEQHRDMAIACRQWHSVLSLVVGEDRS